MKRLFPRVMPRAVAGGVLGLVGALVMTAGCAPKNDVKPGAPILTKLTIIESGPVTTDITATTTDCAAATTEGGSCDPMTDAAACKQADTFCRCQSADGMTGTWSCHFSPLTTVLAIFDRVLDPTPFAPPTGATGVTDVASLTAMPAPATAPTALTDYGSNGSPTGLIFPIFGQYVFGNFRFAGPSLLTVPDPGLPAGATVVYQLDKTKVRAKDGKTPFAGMGFLADGRLSFATAAFSASITVPVAPEPDAGATDSDGGADGGAADDGGADGALPDAGLPEVATGDAAASEAGSTTPPPRPVPPDMSPVTVTFNNAVNPDTIGMQITVTVNGAPFTAFTVDASMAPTITVTPMTTWPASATIVVTVKAAAADVTGVTLGADVSETFITAAM